MCLLLGRREFLGGALAASLPMGRGGALAALERRSGGRLGVAVVGGVSLSHRAGERFAFCSAFKLSLAALVLAGAEAGEWRLDERLAYTQADLLPNSPVTAAHLAEGGMSMAALAEAAHKTSDNAAANLLLRRIGGPQRLNRFWRSLGDRTTRLDAIEPALNRVPPGSLPNTTTPLAMASTLHKMLGEGGLSAPAAARLKGWMHDTQTGAHRLRAGFPADWWAGDKTGTGLPADLRGTYVDLAWVEPPGAAPFAVAAFYQPPRPTPNGDPRAESVLAEVAELVAHRAPA